MTSKFEVGDHVVISDNEAQIVKVINDGDVNSNTLYLVKNKGNQFAYESEETMSGSGGSNAHNSSVRKRQKIDSQSKSETTDQSTKSTASATNWWSGKQIQRFNISFKSNCRDFKSAFVQFFNEDFTIDSDDVNFKKLSELQWNRVSSVTTDSLYTKLVKQYYQFQLYQSEASAECCIRTLFSLFNLESLLEKHSIKFGTVDMLLYSTQERAIMINCAVENKPGGTFDLDNHEKCRCQLVAYMISIAIENAHQCQINCGNSFPSQNILGILHMGLTPIFYKATITDSYLKSIKPLYDKFVNMEPAALIPELIIHEFAPIFPYCDRELLVPDSGAIIFKCYKAFKNLMETYATEKIAFLSNH